MGDIVMKPKYYLAFIHKSSFIDLYKYGYIYVSNPINCSRKISTIKDATELFEKLTSKINCFEYTFEYLMLHYMADSSTKDKVDIINVQKIYVLDEEAQREVEASLDHRIQIDISKWSDMFHELQRKLFLQQSMAGIDNIWKIFDLEKDDKEKCEQIVTTDVVNETIKELFANERPIAELPVWVYLLRYERHNLYPNNIMGYFCDFIHVVLNFLDKEEGDRDVEECTEIGKNLRGDSFNELIKCVEASESFMNMCGDIEDRCKLHIVAPLFLFLRESFADGLVRHKQLCGMPYDSFIKTWKDKFHFEFSVVSYLLGLTLGYDKTYEAYYEKINLPIFKDRKQTDLFGEESTLGLQPSKKRKKQ